MSAEGGFIGVGGDGIGVEAVDRGWMGERRITDIGLAGGRLVLNDGARN